MVQVGEDFFQPGVGETPGNEENFFAHRATVNRLTLADTSGDAVRRKGNGSRAVAF